MAVVVSWTPGVAALARVTWLCVRGLGRLTILRLPACVSNLDFALKSYGPEKVLCGRWWRRKSRLSSGSVRCFWTGLDWLWARRFTLDYGRVIEIRLFSAFRASSSAVLCPMHSGEKTTTLLRYEALVESVNDSQRVCAGSVYSVRWRQKVKRLTGLERSALVMWSGVVQHVETSGACAWCVGGYRCFWRLSSGIAWFVGASCGVRWAIGGRDLPFVNVGPLRSDSDFGTVRTPTLECILSPRLGCEDAVTLLR